MSPLLLFPGFGYGQTLLRFRFVSFRLPFLSSLFSSFSLPLLFRFCFCCCFVIVNHRNVSSVCECVCLLGEGGQLGVCCQHTQNLHSPPPPLLLPLFSSLLPIFPHLRFLRHFARFCFRLFFLWSIDLARTVRGTPCPST